MRCFFNAIGLEADMEIAKLKSKSDDSLVRYMIANEIVSAAANPAQLPQSVKDVIQYTLYEARRGADDVLDKKRSDRLCEQSTDGNLQDTRVLPPPLQNVGQRKQKTLENLRQRAFSPEAFHAFLDDHIGSENMMVALHDVQGEEGDNPHANYTSIDAIAYVNNLGIKLYNPDKHGGLRLAHQYIPQDAKEVAYLYHKGVHFQALVPIDSSSSGAASSRSFSASSSQSSNPHREPPETDTPPSSSSPTDLSVIHSLVTGIDCSTEECSKDFSEQISQALPRLVNLRTLILDGIFSINRESSLPSHFSNILASTPHSIEVLSMNDNLFHESSFSAVIKYLDSQPHPEPRLPSPSSPPTLTKRELTEDQRRHFGGLLKDISAPISCFQNLRVLRMANVYRNADFFFPIRELLQSLPASLEELDLRGTSFSTGDLIFLANDKEVRAFPNLKIVKLSKAGIEDGKMLARFLKQTQLQEFTFIDSLNEADFFIEFLKELSTRRAEWQESDITFSLVKLDISNNKEIGKEEDDVIKVSVFQFGPSTFFNQILGFKHLKELDITRNNIDGDLIKDFVDRILSYNGLPNLQYIGCLEGNEISTKRRKNKPDHQGICESGHEEGMEDIPSTLSSQEDEIVDKLSRLKNSKEKFAFD